ncbi:uncharacterized protein LOC106179912 [Lingula anatina]|uniref:Uncharacterized protein LOC106179912 n=1 Tax=Lingula anatina TaxID=7574 RepID=A0A1S3K9Q2_LINAN|nr:uncharacterized protein LOC106179912 [Lingula anatina]|eukprot:XP_013419174.1 uncharacterized protein LOC106179912 [Lingula anatina]
MSTQKTSAFSTHLSTFFENFGGSYPPRPVFHDWPACFKIYQDVCLEMPEKLHTLNSPEEFRKWMTVKLNDVNLSEVDVAITAQRGARWSPVLAGYLGCLAYLAHAYRWGTVPTTSRERERTTLQFPACLWEPFKKVNDYFGLPYRGNHFSLMACNALYDENGAPVDMKFNWNYDPEIASQENNFKLLMVKAECETPHILSALGRYLDLLEMFSVSGAVDVDDIEERMIEEVYVAKRHLAAALMLVNKNMHENFISRKIFAPHVQGMIAWGIDSDIGSSASENLIFQAINVFCNMEGGSEMSRFGKRTRGNIPENSRALLKSFEESTERDLFPTEKLRKAKADVITVYYSFILGHARKVPEYIAESHMTASGFLKEDLVCRFKRQMKERCDEVSSARNKALGRSSDASFESEDVGNSLWSWSKAAFQWGKEVLTSHYRLMIVLILSS